MSLIEELIQEHLYVYAHANNLKQKFLYYISNKYQFIDYNKLYFDIKSRDSDYKIELTFGDKYTQFVLIEDFIKVSRLHKLYKLMNKDITQHFNTLAIECTFTITNNDI